MTIRQLQMGLRSNRCFRYYDPATALIASAVIGGGTSLLAADKASSAAKSSSKKAGKVADKQTQLYDFLKQLVDNSSANGVFDSNKQMQEARAESDKSMTRDMNNAAGAFRIAGYTPGDTPITEGLTSIAGNYMQDLANKAYSAKQNALLQQLSAYNMVGSSSLGTAANIYQNQANTSQNQANQAYSGVSSLLGNLGSYIPSATGSGKDNSMDSIMLRNPGLKAPDSTNPFYRFE